MENNGNFVVYEYKNISVRRDSVSIYADCLHNFGWIPVEEGLNDFKSMLSGLNPVRLGVNIVNAVQGSTETTGSPDMVTLKFKRDRRISNKVELNRLERKCEDALTAIGSIERKNAAYTMGLSLGAGILGTVFLGFAVHSFRSSNPVVSVILAIVGVAGWGIGFLANRKVGQKKSAQGEPKVQEQLDIAFSACEQAHALLA